VVLETFEKILLTYIFAQNEYGRRRYRRIYIQGPKGFGKSALSAWVGLFQLCSQRSPVLPVAASTDKQAELVFGDMKACIRNSEELSARFEFFDEVIRQRNGPGYAYRVASVGGSNDGARISTALMDEIHLLTTREHRALWDVIQNGCAKREDSLLLATSTPGWDLDTPAGELHQYGKKWFSGEINDPEFAMIWWGCDPSTDPERFNLETDKGRKAAIRQANPASGAFVNVADHARRYTKDHQANFLRYFLGLWTSREDSWLPAGAWGACQATEARDDLVWDRDREVWTVRDGADVVLGFDGSVSQDSTALVVWTRGDRPHCDLVAIWEQPDDEREAAEWAVPVAAVEQTIREACRRWRVQEIAADPARWQKSLQALTEEKLPVVEFPMRPERMMPATQRFYEAIVSQKGLTHSGDPRLSRHVGNAVVKADQRGQRIMKDSLKSQRKVDAAVAAIIGFDRASQPKPDEYDVLQSIW
jgi:phage terminase large subunit-like protein